MDERRQRLAQSLYAFGLMASGLYFTLLGYVLEARGEARLALLAALGALTFALLLLREALPGQAES